MYAAVAHFFGNGGHAVTLTQQLTRAFVAAHQKELLQTYTHGF